MKRQRWVALLIIAALIAAGVWTIIQSRSSEEKESVGAIHVGATAPIFELTTIQGQKVRLADYKGQVVVINFWASWCGPCVQEMPLIDRIHQTQAPEVTTLFINVGESKGTVVDYLESQHFSFPVSIDITGKVSGLYGITGLPATFIIDESGVIRRAVLGEITDYSQLESWVENAKSPLEGSNS
ncbi:TlpA family protein disulfide reductase [Paenibacillus monticola]|uniref:Redoxin domain-containing protein n=1 Tax=Paenibacillus monticola TaxID=2666075 RepID=A0A7X2H362_9BACL|nr:TlpA disulfide reductase family protein [Paenibacillus monticola]MRN52707.1 redoxin domain-containing protein [Paenibacillus monticola]